MFVGTFTFRNKLVRTASYFGEAFSVATNRRAFASFGDDFSVLAFCVVCVADASGAVFFERTLAAYTASTDALVARAVIRAILSDYYAVRTRGIGR